MRRRRGKKRRRRERNIKEKMEDKGVVGSGRCNSLYLGTP